MAIVSVSEAARLVGKSRRTIQRDIAAGKLSKCDNGKKARHIRAYTGLWFAFKTRQMTRTRMRT